MKTNRPSDIDAILLFAAFTAIGGAGLFCFPQKSHGQTPPSRATPQPIQLNSPSPSPKPSSPIPQTAQEGYDTEVPQSVQTDRKDKQFQAKLDNLEQEIKALKATIPDPTKIEAINKELDTVMTYQRTLNVLTQELSEDVTHIKTIIGAYGNGYQASQAIQDQKRDAERKRLKEQSGPDPLNLNKD